MRQQLETRINELQSEFDAGKKMLAEYENKSTDLNQMLLRISGAIQVLKEEVEKANEEKPEKSDFSNERVKQTSEKNIVAAIE